MRCGTLVLMLFLTSNSLFASDVYFCSEDAKVGFNPKENYKFYDYTLDRFTVNIDFQEEKVVSKELGFQYERELGHCLKYEDNLSCWNYLSETFAINKTTLKFHMSTIYIQGEESTSDDILISHGSCEKF